VVESHVSGRAKSTQIEQLYLFFLVDSHRQATGGRTVSASKLNNS
jgi:hypothetical protein